jgi:hypothetical protein
MTVRARDLVDAYEATLSERARALGAHYTPSALAARVAQLAAVGHGPVVDPACGAGALLLAAGDRLVDAGYERAVVARDLLWGADVDPGAVRVAIDAITTWSGGAAPAPGHVVVGDPLLQGEAAWGDPPAFAAVVGNPPFQGQLASGTARSRAAQRALRARYGDAVVAYVDTAALFLLLGVELAAPGARVAMVQPQSVVASRDAGPVREALAARAALVDLWASEEQLFLANVHVCVPVLEVGSASRASWSERLASARGVPAVELDAGATLGSMVAAVTGFRQHHYGLVDHVRESEGDDTGALVTSGLIDVGRSAWGERPVRFAKRSWARPVVDVAAVHMADGWLDRVLRPKVLVASQTRVLEAVADHLGTWVPATPVVSLVPHEPTGLDLVAAAVCAPPAAAWAARRAAGTGLSAASIRVSADLLTELPLPPDRAAWRRAAVALRAGDLHAFAPLATAMHGLPRQAAVEVLTWWQANRPQRTQAGRGQVLPSNSRVGRRAGAR